MKPPFLCYGFVLDFPSTIHWVTILDFWTSILKKRFSKIPSFEFPSMKVVLSLFNGHFFGKCQVWPKTFLDFLRVPSFAALRELNLRIPLGEICILTIRWVFFLKKPPLIFKNICFTRKLNFVDMRKPNLYISCSEMCPLTFQWTFWVDFLTLRKYFF